MQRHQVGIFTVVFLPGISVSYQKSRTVGVILGPSMQHAATSGADREFAHFITSRFNS